MENTILLYLPWVPLHEKQSFNVDFEDEGKSKKSKDKEQSINMVLYLTTASLGIFQVTLAIKQQNKLLAMIEAQSKININPKAFEYINDTFKKEMETNNICSIIRTFVNNTDLNNTGNLPAPTQDKKQNSKQRVCYQQPSQISPKLIIAAHSITKIIFEADEKEFD